MSESAQPPEIAGLTDGVPSGSVRPTLARKRLWGRRFRPMPHTFWHAEHHPWNVGQDGILRAGCQPARAACLEAIRAGYQPAAGCQPAPQFLPDARFREKYVALGAFACQPIFSRSHSPRQAPISCGTPSESRAWSSASQSGGRGGSSWGNPWRPEHAAATPFWRRPGGC